jgi:hypothetical protein
MTTITRTPLHGTKTQSLSDVALAALSWVARGPLPRHKLNPGVTTRLRREALIEVVDLPSPYKTKKGLLPHLRITDAGRARLALVDSP